MYSFPCCFSDFGRRPSWKSLEIKPPTVRKSNNEQLLKQSQRLEQKLKARRFVFCGNCPNGPETVDTHLEIDKNCLIESSLNHPEHWSPLESIGVHWSPLEHQEVFQGVENRLSNRSFTKGHWVPIPLEEGETTTPSWSAINGGRDRGSVASTNQTSGVRATPSLESFEVVKKNLHGSKRD